MIDFIQAHKHQLLYLVAVLITVGLLRFLTNLFHKWLLKQENKKFPGEGPKSVHIVKRILNVLWMLLGVMALGYIFLEEAYFKSFIGDFKLVFYLGFLTVCTIVCASTVNMWFRHTISKKIENQEDPTSFKFLGYVAVFGIYFFGVFFGLLAFPAFKGIAQTALGGAGIIAIIAGVSSQEALSNLVGGIFIITFKPFKIGDIIQVTDTMVGTVADITLRHTVIKNFENKMIVIPNAIINKEKLINYDLGEKKCCERIEIGISYDSNVKLAKKIMQEECEGHPLILDNRTKLEKKDGMPVVKTALTKLNDSSVTVRAWCWCKNYSESFQLRIDVLESIKLRFEQEGIEIPFPYRTIVMKKEESKKVKSNGKGLPS
ncbi:MAG TPA: mechanosensitive ion channel family protein [Fulvivirga sp.]|nr:mechanosensitive ion channel family protein [Fulvivirga sp.]